MAYGEAVRRNRCGVWCWRWAVPLDLREALGLREVSRSLGTSSRRVAVARSLALRNVVVSAVDLVRSGVPVKNTDLIEALKAAKLVHQQRIERSDAEAVEIADRRSGLALELVRQEERVHLDRLREQAVKIITDQHHAGLVQAEAHRAQLGHVFRAAAAASEGGAHGGGTVCLSVCFAELRAEKLAAAAWNAKTLERWDFTFRVLLEALGDMPVSQVRRKQLTLLMTGLRKMPSNAQKMKPLAGKTFNELIEIAGFALVSDGTVNDFMQRVSGFFKWCMKVDGYGVKVNPADGLSVKAVKRTKRRPFTVDQLVALFSHESYTSRRFLHPHYFWLMPMSMLTGMRLNELCQLKLVDFDKVEGVPVIRCADLGEDQRGKNENATRRVPIHRELIRMGLLRWVDEQRARGEVQLFPELKAGRDGHGQGPSKWFGRFRKTCGIASKQTEVFHSFRHLFISARLNCKIAEDQIAAVVGHETGLVTGNIYWSDRDAGALLAVVEAVEFPEAVRGLVPTIDDIQFVKVPRRPPSRLGVRKSRDKRIADAAARKAPAAA